MVQQLSEGSQQATPALRVMTLGTFLILRQVNGTWGQVIDKDLSARGPSLTFLKVLISSSPSLGSHKHAGSLTPWNWELHEAPRDVLIDAIWPEEGMAPVDPDRAVTVAKSVLNRALRPSGGDDIVLLTDGSDKLGYRLNARVVTIDADEFEVAVLRACEAEGRGEREDALRQWEIAFALVRGVFLPHDQYNDWSRHRRERLHSKYCLCLHRLARLYTDDGRTTEVVEKLHPHVLTHPTDLDALCLLLPVLGQQGRYEEALHLMDTCKQTLQDEGKPLPRAIIEIENRFHQEQEAVLMALSRSVFSPIAKVLPISAREDLLVEQERQVVTSLSQTSHDLITPLAFSSPSLTSETPVKENATWFTLKHQLIHALVTQWNGRAMYCDELQEIIDQELRMFDLVKTLYHQQTYMTSRRSILRAIAASPLALLLTSPRQQQTIPPVEEFLPECAASITSCWYLLNGDGFSTIEQTLPMYLPILVSWARQSWRYQSIAANIAAQGSLLMDLVSYHRFRFQDSLAYAHQAVELAKLSGDCNLSVYALMLLGGALNLNGQSQAMLQKQQAATLYLDEVVPALRSYALAEVAYAYAQNGQVPEALQSIGEARRLFPSDFGDVPCFVSADYDISQLVVFEGLTHLTLGETDPDHAHQHNEQAAKALAQIEDLPSDMLLPQRLKIEIVNYQAQAAVGAGNLDEFEHYLIAGAKGAASLGSEKRRQEVLANWRAARKVWPHEQKVLALADMFI